MSDAQVPSDELFSAMPPLYTDDLFCWLVREGKLVAISTPRDGGGATVFLNVSDARLIRDWLNKVLP